MHPEAEGISYPPTTFTVDPERVRAFAGLFGQGSGVPPTFATAAEFAGFPEMIADPRLGLDFSRVLHGSQSYTFERPLRRGETLRAQTTIESVRVRAGTGFLTVRTELREDDGALVATARAALIERGPYA